MTIIGDILDAGSAQNDEQQSKSMRSRSRAAGGVTRREPQAEVRVGRLARPTIGDAINSERAAEFARLVTLIKPTPTAPALDGRVAASTGPISTIRQNQISAILEAVPHTAHSETEESEQSTVTATIGGASVTEQVEILDSSPLLLDASRWLAATTPSVARRLSLASPIPAVATRSHLTTPEQSVGSSPEEVLGSFAPLEFNPEQEKKCGPNITRWFIKEMARWAEAIAHMKAAAGRKGGVRRGAPQELMDAFYAKRPYSNLDLTATLGDNKCPTDCKDYVLLDGLCIPKQFLDVFMAAFIRGGLQYRPIIALTPWVFDSEKNRARDREIIEEAGEPAGGEDDVAADLQEQGTRMGGLMQEHLHKNPREGLLPANYALWEDHLSLDKDLYADPCPPCGLTYDIRGVDTPRVDLDSASLGAWRDGPITTASPYLRGVCGPDVTDWFLQQLAAWRRFAVAVREKQDLPCILFILNMFGYSRAFGSASYEADGCPDDCRDTVRFCGECIEKRLLDQIFWGFLGGAMLVPLDFQIGMAHASLKFKAELFFAKFAIEAKTDLHEPQQVAGVLIGRAIARAISLAEGEDADLDCEAIQSALEHQVEIYTAVETPWSDLSERGLGYQEGAWDRAARDAFGAVGAIHGSCRDCPTSMTSAPAITPIPRSDLGRLLGGNILDWLEQNARKDLRGWFKLMKRLRLIKGGQGAQMDAGIPGLEKGDRAVGKAGADEGGRRLEPHAERAKERAGKWVEERWNREFDHEKDSWNKTKARNRLLLGKAGRWVHFPGGLEVAEKAAEWIVNALVSCK